jgi:hypothetical protein
MTLQTPSNAIFQTPFKRLQTPSNARRPLPPPRAQTPFKRPSNAKLHIRPSNALHTPSPSECRRPSDGLSTHPHTPWRVNAPLGRSRLPAELRFQDDESEFKRPSKCSKCSASASGSSRDFGTSATGSSGGVFASACREFRVGHRTSQGSRSPPPRRCRCLGSFLAALLAETPSTLLHRG